MSIINFYADNGDTGETVTVHGHQSLSAVQQMFPGFMVTADDEHSGCYRAEVYGALALIPFPQCHNARIVKVINLDGTVETYRRPIVGNRFTTPVGYINRAQFMSLITGENAWAVYNQDLLISVEYEYDDTIGGGCDMYVMSTIFNLMDIPRADFMFRFGSKGFRLHHNTLSYRTAYFRKAVNIEVHEGMLLTEAVRSVVMEILKDFTMVGRERDRMTLFGLANKCKLLLLKENTYRPGQEAESMRTFFVARMFSNEVNLYHGKQLIDSFDLRTHTLDNMMTAYRHLDISTQCIASKVLQNVPFATKL